MRFAAVFLLCAPLFAQTRPLTAADYARAEKFMAYNTTPLVYRATVRPNWIADDRFWYRVTTPAGSEFVLVDPAKGTRAPAFDHAKLAIALTAAANSKYEAGTLPFTEIDLTADGQYVSFNAAGSAGSATRKAPLASPQAPRCHRPAGRGGRGGGRGGGSCRCAFTGRPARRLHSRLEPLGARRRHP